MNNKLIENISADEFLDFYQSGKFIRHFLISIKNNQVFYKASLNSRNSFPINRGLDMLWKCIAKLTL